MRMPCAAAVPAQMEATRIDNNFMFREKTGVLDERFRSFHSASDLYSYSRDTFSFRRPAVSYPNFDNYQPSVSLMNGS